MSYLNDDMGYMSCDGIFGAAWPSVSSFGVEPPLQRVLNQLDKPLFSVWLDKHPKASPTYTGLITYGALDAKNCDGSWNFLPLIGETFWNYDFSLGTKKLRGTSGQTVTVDTGTSWLNFPSAVVDTIMRKIGAEYDNNDDLYYTDCGNIGLPDFVFRFGKQNYALTSDDYLLSTSSGRCAVKVYPQDLIGGWLVGDTFIRRYCHAFDIGGRRIGLAKAKQ
ncbi:aspartyl protease-like protein [Aphelenchoides avenae]|nr:aspartyl protease-like protein [Aphelenchus avenae]